MAKSDAQTTISLNIKSEDAEALQALTKLAAAQEKIEKNAKQINEAQRQQKQEVEQGSSAWDRITAAASGAIAGMMSIQKVTQLLGDYLDYLDRIGDKQEDLAKSAVELTLLNPGREQEALFAAARLGQEYGIGPAESWGIVQPIQSNIGDLDKSLEASRTAMAMVGLGTEPEIARRLIAYGQQFGYTPGQSTSLVYAAAQHSQFGPGAMAETVPGWMMWDDPTLAAAAASVVSGAEQEPRRLRTLLEAASRSLTKTENRAYKELGFAGIPTFGGRLERLRSALGDDISKEGLSRLGITETEEQRSLFLMLSNWDRIKQEQAFIAGRDPGVAQKMFDYEYSANPQMRLALKAQRAQAMEDIRDFWANAEYRNQQIEMASELGFGWGTEGGKVTRIGMPAAFQQRYAPPFARGALGTTMPESGGVALGAAFADAIMKLLGRAPQDNGRFNQNVERYLDRIEQNTRQAPSVPVDTNANVE